MSDDIKIRPIISDKDVLQVEELQRLVWPGSETDVVPGHIILTIAHNGGLALGAFDGETLVGFVLGFLGTDSESPDRPAMARLKHCSHMLGVIQEYRDQGIGYRLKSAQRDTLITQGIRLATWTYDPLQSRNANLNIRRLGTICSTYLRNVYGEMRDDLNVGYPSDRFQVEWWVTSSRVRERVAGDRRPLDLAHYLAAGVQKINPTSLDDKNLLHPTETPYEVGGVMILIEIPSDITFIKAEHPDIALQWRLHTRMLFEEAFDKGYMVTDFIYLKGEKIPRSYYLLTHGGSTLG